MKKVFKCPIQFFLSLLLKKVVYTVDLLFSLIIVLENELCYIFFRSDSMSRKKDLLRKQVKESLELIASLNMMNLLLAELISLNI